MAGIKDIPGWIYTPSQYFEARCETTKGEMIKESSEKVVGGARHAPAHLECSMTSPSHDPLSRKMKSVGSANSTGESKTSKFPPINAFRRLSKLALSAEPVKGNNRRSSHAFPVTAWQSEKEQRETAAGNFWKRLRNTKSNNDLVRSASAKGSTHSWQTTMMLSKAKRKLSIGGEKALLKRKLSLKDFMTVASMNRSDHDKRKMIRDLKRKSLLRRKALLAKFRMAAKLAIFCARNFKQHCLRINESQDELAPFIKRLHFREDDTSDLLIDLSQFKANRQLRIPDEAKRILSKELESRTDQEVYSVTVALRNIKSYAEYPNRMQKKIAEVGLYEKYESKRVIVRQNHPATAFYFILSGAVVVMVMDEETKFARPVAHLYKGHTFGELAIINGTKRNSTVIAKETCEFLSISVQDYHKIFMAGGVKNISDPDQEIFLKSLKCLANWPIHILPQNPNKCQFLFFKNANVIIRDSNISEWIIIVKSGSVQVLKKLKKVEAFAWKKKKQEQIILTDRRDLSIKQTDFRRILPQLRIPLNPDMEEEEVDIQTNGRPLPFRHPIDNFDTESTTSSQPMVSRIPNLWPFNVDLSQMESGRYLEDEHRLGKLRKNQIAEVTTGKKSGLRIVARSLSEGLGVKTGRDRSASMINEEEAELGGFQAHIRTIQEDLDPSAARQKVTDTDETVDLNPEFVLVHTLTKGQVFGLSDVIIGEQPSFSVVSKGADCILINKNFYLEHASDRLINEMRQELCPYPTEEQLQQGLQENVDWHAYRKTMLLKSLSTVGVRRQLRSTINGTKVQEAY